MSLGNLFNKNSYLLSILFVYINILSQTGFKFIMFSNNDAFHDPVDPTIKKLLQC